MNNEISKSLQSVTPTFTAIIPDTPIVSIAGSTLSEITTTTTSTTTTPTPISEPTKANISIPDPMSDAVAKLSGSVSALNGPSAHNTNLSGIFRKDQSAPVNEKINTVQDTESKDSESWEEERLTDLDDKCLKNLLEEAYSYKNPRDKENKSERFLHLLKEAENETEDQTISFKALASQFSRNSPSSNSSNNHHQHKQGGSLQDLVNTVHNESLLTRYNHNSRQKKYSVSVSSRSREGGSLPCNVNVSNYGGSFGVEQSLFLHEIKNNKQRRSAKVSTTIGKESEIETHTYVENNASNFDHAVGSAARVLTGATSSGDFVIDVEEPIIDIQQKQHIFQCKAQDVLAPDPPYYERLENLEKRIPRANMISPHIKNEVAVTCTTGHIDEAVRFNTLERGKANDTKILTVNENYTACKSVLGEKSELVKTPTTMFSTKTIPRQFDENGNSLNEVYQTGTPAALMNASLGNINATAIGALSQSQAKGKSKKKSHQDRNTKTVNVETLAGFRGADPVEELVKYIENSEDKQLDSKGNNNKLSDNSKKKDRKKEKNHKIKKSNSLEELSSRAKIEVVGLQRTAATTETNLMMPSKNNKQNPNSSSSVDINRGFESSNSKDITCVNKTNNPSAARKCERRFWGTEELQYLENYNNEEKPKDKRNNKHKEKEKEKDTEKDKEKEKQKDKDFNYQRDKTVEIDQKTHAIFESTKTERIEKAEKIEKRKKSESNVFTEESSAVNTAIFPVDSLMPETAEFHVVTKKKKPKKQRTFLDEAGGSNNNNVNVPGSSRTTNFVTNTQKPGAFIQQPQQNRHKYYHSQGCSGSNERTDYSNSNYNPNYTHHTNNQQRNINPLRDKSRRKSTSSMPPSEKSDSSDLDSVHSLPIESTVKNQQRHNTVASTDATSISYKAAVSNGQSNSTLISYADIARTTKEITAVIVSAVDKLTVDENLKVSKESPACAEDIQTVSDLQAPTTYFKSKAKKILQRQDFPELVSSSTIVSSENIIKTNTFKAISYSQSLATTLSPTNTVTIFTNCDAQPPSTAITASSTKQAELQDLKPERRNVAIDNIKSETSLSIVPSKQQAQPLQKSKSVEYETYNYNSSNMDQQYPALEKTVKRHSAANVTISVIPTAVPPPVQFNFAAVAKQQLNLSNELTQKPVAISIPLETTTTSMNAVANRASVSCANTSSTAKKTTINETLTQNANCLRKNKKVFGNEKQPIPSIYALDSIATDSNSTTNTLKSSQAKYQSSCLKEVSNGNPPSVFNPHRLPDSKANSTSSSSINLIDVQTAAPSTALSNRPAVIILNDDRNVGDSSEFTFGDFNADEFKLFDDATFENNNVTTNIEFTVDCDVQQYQALGTTKPRVALLQKTNVSPIAVGVYLHNSDVSSNIVQRSTQNCDGGLILTGVVTSSPTSSCIASQSSNKSSYSDTYGLHNNSEAKRFSQEEKTEDIVNMHTFLSPLKSVVVCKSAIKNEHRNSSNDCCPRPQHLETCNDIEAAILAAARLAAEQQNCQQPQQFEVLNSSSNSSSFSSSSSVSTDYAHMGSNDSHHHNEDCITFNSCQPHSITGASLFVNNHHKEFKVNFIAPSVKPAINVLHNNEIIVDYIGSAWEEILKSKVAIVYDGQ